MLYSLSNELKLKHKYFVLFLMQQRGHEGFLFSTFSPLFSPPPFTVTDFTHSTFLNNKCFTEYIFHGL